VTSLLLYYAIIMPGCITNFCASPTVNSIYAGPVTEVNALAYRYPIANYGMERYRHTSFLTCKISDHTSSATGVIIVPFKW
jgi:hypothetical protein